nr:hypothetical protein Iba_chr01aCG6230 [Ipomoea batatas]
MWYHKLEVVTVAVTTVTKAYIDGSIGYISNRSPTAQVTTKIHTPSILNLRASRRHSPDSKTIKGINKGNSKETTMAGGFDCLFDFANPTTEPDFAKNITTKNNGGHPIRHGIGKCR